MTATVNLGSRLDVLKSSGRFDAATLQRFAQFITESSEEALFRMSPLRYAKEHGLSENDAVELFLRATHAGILEFSWGLLCPACSGFNTTAASLKTLAERRRCPNCQLDIELDDDAVEIAFTVSPAVRTIRFHHPDQLTFERDWKRLSWSPSASPPQEIMAKFDTALIEAKRLAPGESHVFRTEYDGKRLALIVPAMHATGHVDLRPGETAHEAELHLIHGAIVPEQTNLAPGPVAVKLHNRSDRSVEVAFLRSPIPALDDRPWMAQGTGHMRRVSTYLTGKRLVTHQTFRELFRAESIPSQDGLHFKSITLLFTDLKGSTEMYGRIGDFRAYGLVRQHFQVLGDLVVGSGGSLVKTIGDAVMATFAEPAAGLEAAAKMTREIKKVGDLELKIGLHSGPCIAVESNERLDYFGQTVNIAARVQGIANANEIAVTKTVFESPRVDQLIASYGLGAEHGRAQLKGVDGDTDIVRLNAGR